MGANVQPQGINVQVRGFLFNLFLLLLSLSSLFLSLSHTPFFFLALSSSSNKTQPVLDSVMPMGVSFIICEPWRGRITQASAGKRNHETLSHSKRYWKKKQANSQPQGLAVAPVDRMRMNVGVLNNPISGSVYAPVGEHIGM